MIKRIATSDCHDIWESKTRKNPDAHCNLEFDAAEGGHGG